MYFLEMTTIQRMKESNLRLFGSQAEDNNQNIYHWLLPTSRRWMGLLRGCKDLCPWDCNVMMKLSQGNYWDPTHTWFWWLHGPWKISLNLELRERGGKKPTHTHEWTVTTNHLYRNEMLYIHCIAQHVELPLHVQWKRYPLTYGWHPWSRKAARVDPQVFASHI